MRRIYLDNAATTPVDEEVVKEMLPYFTDYYGNPSSLHSLGGEVHNALEKARERVADILNAKGENIVFTGGGTEADNLAIKGVAYRNKEKRGSNGYNIITTSIEHPAVLETCRYLERQGFRVKYLPVDE
ncbi:MAG: aminotransferase class V-fold PLP-dependent enzyme, partial [Thermoplasmata archaeon]|nr:aminotransferase class V-fold PLP-dependent enzyme [Thermoplasmata archaeon]